MKKGLNFLKRISIFSSILFLISLISCNPTSSNNNNYQKFIGNKDYVSPKNVSQEQAENQSTGLDSKWWKESSFYHIWVKSFNDSDGDEIGDLKGIEQKLDYIQNNVGCNAIWLSPIFECAGKGGIMHGYDTTNYYSVNSSFGTEDDLINLIKAVHLRGMQIIFDFVPNHTSYEHPWFTNSLDYGTKRDWYVWSTTTPYINNGMTNTYWYYWNNNSDGPYSYGAFNGGMPDLNYYNYEVREEMKNVARYWLNKGFDGLRLDGARYLMEEGSQGCDTELSHEWYKELRKELDKYSSPKFMICESWVTKNRNCLNSYLGNDDEFHMALDFDQGTRCITSVYNGKKEDSYLFQENFSSNTAYGVFLGNHDEYAVYTNGTKLSSTYHEYTNYIRFGQALKGDRKQINQSLALSIIRPNVPFIYYGNEFGMKELAAGGDMRARGPMKWEQAEEQAASAVSSLNFTKAANALRKLYPKTFAYGNLTEFKMNYNAGLGYRIKGDDGDLLIVLHLGNSKRQTATFTSDISIDNATLIIGNTSAPVLSKTDSTITVSELGPRAIRVYDLTGTYTGEVLFNDDDYNESYSPKNDTSSEPVISSKMYLRGDMNSWSSKEMTKYIEDSNTIWECTIYLNAGTYEFKFADTDDWTGSDWGATLSVSGGITKSSSSYENLSYTASSAGSYTFIFNQTQLSATVDKQ